MFARIKQFSTDLAKFDEELHQKAAHLIEEDGERQATWVINLGTVMAAAYTVGSAVVAVKAGRKAYNGGMVTAGLVRMRRHLKEESETVEHKASAARTTTADKVAA